VWNKSQFSVCKQFWLVLSLGSLWFTGKLVGS
jgi:hypothetical protein